jgi:hypothetical protein
VKKDIHTDGKIYETQKEIYETHYSRKRKKKKLTGLISMFGHPPSQNSMYFQRKNMQSLGPACFGT